MAATMLCLAASPARAGLPDVSLYLMAKGQQFVQSGAGAPALETEVPPHRFVAFVEPSALGNVSSVTLQRVPDGSILTLTNESGETDFHLEDQNFADKSALDAAFPNASYQFTIVTLNQGTQTPTLTLGTDDYPNTPQVSNWAALQDIDPITDTLVTWGAFSGGTATDFVQFRVEDEFGTVFETGEPGAVNSLNGTNTSITIPAGTLEIGKFYSATLLFANISLDTTSYPGVSGVAAFFKETRFDLATAGTVPDVFQYMAVKGQRYSQTNAGAPVLRSDEPAHEFSASVAPSGEGNVLSATLQLPGGSMRTLTNDLSEGDFRIEHRANTKMSLDSAFTNGIYRLNIATAHQGTKSLTLPLTPENYPNTPRIANWAALQSANADGAITVTWDAFVDGTADDFVLFSVEDFSGETIFGTGGPGGPDALNGTNTSITIPAFWLLPNQGHRGRLLFARGSFDTTAYPGALGIAAFYKETEFEFATVSPPPPQGRLSFTSPIYSVSEGGGVVTVTVQRTGGTMDPVSVQLSTFAGTASAGADYEEKVIPLSWPDGDGSSTNVSIPISEDMALEGAELFYVLLSNPSGGAELGVPSQAAVTILDNENPNAGVLRFSASAVSVNENAGRALLTVTRTSGTSGQVSVRYALDGISAEEGEDFDDTGGTLVFSNGVSSRMISVPIVNDTLDESDETFSVSLSEPTGGSSIGTNDHAIVTIKDEDTGGIFGFSATLYSVSETGAVANVIVRRSGGVASQTTVDLFTLAETATDTNDYVGTNITLVFGANVLALTNTIAIMDDDVPDGDETFRVRLANPTGGARLSSATNSVVRILENEVTLQFTSVNYSNKESAVVAIMMIERSGPVNVPASVEFSTGSGTTTAAQDYLATNLVVQFPAGTKKKPVGVRLIKDLIVEGTETLSLSLRNPGPNTLIGPRDEATLSILDDDFGGGIQFAVTNLVVKESAPAASIVLTRSMGKASNVTVRLQTMDVSATDPADYLGTNVVLEWRGNETRKVLPLPLIHDALVEGSERFQARLSEPTGGAWLTNRSNLVINLTDDDLGGTIGFARGSIVVNENGTNAAVVVMRSGGAAGNVTVRLATADGSASVAQPDYTEFNQVLTFGPGESIKTNLVPINNDTLPEGNPPETVLLSLREYTGGAKPGLSNAVISIVDDESSVAFTTNMVMGTEGTAVTLTVARAGALTTTVSVNFMTVGGTAAEGADFLGTNGTLTFGPNQSSKTFTVRLNTDAMAETNESFTVVLTNPQGGVQLGVQSSVVVAVKEAPDPNAVPLAGSEFFRLTATGVTNTTFSRTFNATTTIEALNQGGGVFNIRAITVRGAIPELCTLTLAGFTGPGTYTFDSSGPSDAAYLNGLSPTFSYVMDDPGDFGTIIIDGFDGTRMSGRFNMIMSDNTDATKFIRVVGSFRAIIE